MGEFELIARVRERLREAGVGEGPGVVLGSGDDAAVTVPGDRAAVTSVDAFVDGVHFRRRTAGLCSIGRKAMAGALSDLAAMGAEPGEVYVMLGVPADLDEAGCMEVLEGLVAGASSWGACLAGGDVTRAPALLLALTAVGYAEAPERVVHRGGARPGDAVAVTGELGGAAAGLRILERPALAAGLAPAVAEALRERQLHPEPLLGAGRALAAAGASAMIDLSDGLAGDARHVAAGSGVRLQLDAERVPLQEGVAEVAEGCGLDPLELALGGGEDYELLACLPPGHLERAQELVAAADARLTPIGKVTEGEGFELGNASAAARAVRGFDQLRAADGGEPG